eukprot:TRINITY_DN5285_c0_g1_i1.p1 TRINITY_DN5285_c0_g1~~TRINITY_DN5285_c0_g1_i1.p1  ORF type:complete len:243 (-),score=22.67 TRINITY_DN5285_c0_g1_i1:7-735(-)
MLHSGRDLIFAFFVTTVVSCLFFIALPSTVSDELITSFFPNHFICYFFLYLFSPRLGIACFYLFEREAFLLFHGPISTLSAILSFGCWLICPDIWLLMLSGYHAASKFTFIWIFCAIFSVCRSTDEVLTLYVAIQKNTETQAAVRLRALIIQLLNWFRSRLYHFVLFVWAGILVAALGMFASTGVLRFFVSFGLTFSVFGSIFYAQNSFSTWRSIFNKKDKIQKKSPPSQHVRKDVRVSPQI